MSSGKSDTAKKDEMRFVARIPAQLHEQLTGRAQANGRSMNTEIISILRSALEDPDRARIEELETQLKMVERQIHVTRGQLEGLDRQKFAIVDEIEARRARSEGA